MLRGPGQSVPAPFASPAMRLSFASVVFVALAIPWLAAACGSSSAATAPTATLAATATPTPAATVTATTAPSNTPALPSPSATATSPAATATPTGTPTPTAPAQPTATATRPSQPAATPTPVPQPTATPTLALATHAQIRLVASSLFVPADVEIAAGGTVTWVYEAGMHNIVGLNNSLIDDPLAKQASGQTYTVTFQSAGTFTFHCTVHPERMHGSVRVH